MITGASIAYGLTDGGAQSDQISLTPLALRVFKPKTEGDDLIAKREAFLKPRVVGQFLRQYDGGAVPNLCRGKGSLTKASEGRSSSQHC